MNFRGRTFAVDRANGKLAGVCAGIADMAGIDATFVRVGFVLATLFGFPWVLIAYGVLALVGQPKREDGHRLARAASREEALERTRAMDLRMQAIETYVTSSNSSLAREIEELR